MSGHNKWSKIKNQKQATDAARGKIFTKMANAITLAVKEGGGIADPQSNFHLRLAIEKARENNMPKQNITRAVDRALGRGDEAMQFTEVLYEGFGPGGIAILAQGVTDNKQRTVSEVKNIFNNHGGNLGGTGSAMHFFRWVGEVRVQKDRSFEEVFDLVAQAGAEDLTDEEEGFTVICDPQKIRQVRENLAANLKIISAELVYVPTSEIELDESASAKALALLNALDETDDIHKVYTNAKLKYA